MKTASAKWSSWKAFSVILGSVLMVSVPSYLVVHKLFFKHKQLQKPVGVFQKIIQTGPQKENLKTAFFAEILHLSTDRPVLREGFDTKAASAHLRKHPVMEKAEVEVFPDGSLYIDYVARHPVAMLQDFENSAVDRKGYVFPIRPFFPPKNLPAIYFGTSCFGKAPQDSVKPLVTWNKPLEGPLVELAFTLLELLLTSEALKGTFEVKTIDVSNALAPSLGSREIVLEIEESLLVPHETKKVTVCQRRLLRLSSKNYAKELGNYLKLRDKLAIEQMKALQQGSSSFFQTKMVVDLRLEKIAFVKQG